MPPTAKRRTTKKAARDTQPRRGVLDLPKGIDERLAEGHAQRESVPLEAHGEWATPDSRPDPVGIIEKQNATRVPELVPIRHGRMIVSPFTFYRGTAAIMASDLSRSPTTELRVQCCGDAHLSNFGLFAAPDRRVVFDLNDFDETLPAPFEWDVKRLAASVVVAARGNGHRRKEQRAAARAAVAAYRRTMAKAASDAVPGCLVHAVRRGQAARGARSQGEEGGDQVREEGPRQGADADEPALVVEVRAAGRGRLPDQAAAAGDRAPARDDVRRLRAGHPPGTRRLCELAGPRSARRARPLPLRGFRAQGLRRRLGRDRGADDPADGRPRGRPAVPAAQGGEHVGARPVCGRQRV